MAKPAHKGTKREPMLTSGQIRERGWTDGMIRNYLRKHDDERVNMHYRSGPRVRLWKLSRVERAEKGRAADALAEAIAKRKQRQGTAQRAVRTKVSGLLDRIENMEISVMRLPLATVVRNAMSAAYTHDGGYRQMRDESDADFIDRMVRNYIRHELTEYDYALHDLIAQTGKEEGYELLRERIEDAIDEAYPEVATYEHLHLASHP